MNALITTLTSRLRQAANRFFRRVAVGASDGLEEYLSSAKNLHQLEDMQRRWDRQQRGRHTFGTH